MLSKRIFGLLRQRNTINQEEDTRHRPSLKKPFDEGSRRARLASAGCHFNQKLATARRDLLTKLIYAAKLVVSLDNVFVDLHPERVPANLPCGGPAFEVRLREERFDGMRERLGLPIPETNFLAIGEKDVRHIELLRVASRLRFGFRWIYRGSFRLDYSQRTSVTIAKDIVRACPILNHYLVTDSVLVL